MYVSSIGWKQVSQYSCYQIALKFQRFLEKFIIWYE